MAVAILMPALSPTMTKGNLAKWHKSIGDKIKPGDIIADIETDKAIMEVESVDAGVISKILIPAGATGVKVNELIAVLSEPGDNDSSIAEIISKHQSNNTPTLLQKEAVQEDAAKLESSINNKANQANQASRIFASPLAKSIAKQNDVQLDKVVGTGPNGRIVKADVLTAMTTVHKPVSSWSVNSISQEAIEKPISMMRQTIAKRLQESKQNIPHFYLSLECNIEELLNARAKLNEIGYIKLSVNDFVVKACAMALIKHRSVNATYDSGKITEFSRADISIAVAVDDGLITPIVKSADLKSLSTISADVKDLATRAKSGLLKPNEFQGGTFTISNLGMYGIDEFAAIINPPQAAILAVGAAKKQPIVLANGTIGVATMMRITLSCDHRVVDGAVAAQFLQSIKLMLENPAAMLL